MGNQERYRASARDGSTIVSTNIKSAACSAARRTAVEGGESTTVFDRATGQGVVYGRYGNVERTF